MSFAHFLICTTTTTAREGRNQRPIARDAVRRLPHLMVLAIQYGMRRAETTRMPSDPTVDFPKGGGRPAISSRMRRSHGPGLAGTLPPRLSDQPIPACRSLPIAG